MVEGGRVVAMVTDRDLIAREGDRLVGIVSEADLRRDEGPLEANNPAAGYRQVVTAAVDESERVAPGRVGGNVCGDGPCGRL